MNAEPRQEAKRAVNDLLHAGRRTDDEGAEAFERKTRLVDALAAAIKVMDGKHLGSRQREDCSECNEFRRALSALREDET